MLEAVGVVERVHVGPLEPVARHHEQVDRQIRPLEGLELRRLAADVRIRAELALDQILAEGQRHGDGGAEDKGGVDRAHTQAGIGVLLRRVLEVHVWSLAAMLFLSSAAFDLCCQIRLLLPTRGLSIFLDSPDRRSLLGARDASVASLELSVVLGRRTFNRVVEARAAVRPTVQALPDACCAFGDTGRI